MGRFVQLKDGNGGVLVAASPVPIATVTGSAGDVDLEPGYYYQAGELSSLTFTLVAPDDNDFTAQYHITFTSGSSPTTVNWPDGLLFNNPPNIESGKTYEVDIINNLCIICSYQ